MCGRIKVVLWEPGLEAEVFVSNPERVRVTVVEGETDRYVVDIELLDSFDEGLDYVARVVRKGSRNEKQHLAGIVPSWVRWTNGSPVWRTPVASHRQVSESLSQHVPFTTAQREELRARGIVMGGGRALPPRAPAAPVFTTPNFDHAGHDRDHEAERGPRLDADARSRYEDGLPPRTSPRGPIERPEREIED